MLYLYELLVKSAHMSAWRTNYYFIVRVERKRWPKVGKCQPQAGVKIPRVKINTFYFKLLQTFLPLQFPGGGQGAGDREKRGREVYGRREKRGREAGFPRTREAGEKGKNYATLGNISQSKKCKGREPKNTGREPGLKGTGSGRFKPPCSPPFPGLSMSI